MAVTKRDIIITITSLAIGAGGTFLTINKQTNNNVQQVIAPEPVITPKLEIPTAEEATTAFRKRIGGLKYSQDEYDNDTIILGDCFEGTVTQIQCGADIDFKGNGIINQREVGFTKTPSGWIAKLL